MSILTKVAGDWKLVAQPWLKVGGHYEKATMVWVKANDVWQEAWPLDPGPARSVTVDTVYRNDRIEIDVDWLAPAAGTGQPVDHYIVHVSIANAATGPVLYTHSATIDAPTTGFTLTNSGAGYHTYAGKKLYATVWGVTAAMSMGPGVKSPAINVSQLPPPPAPATYSVDIKVCRATHTWTQTDTGRRVTGFELMTQFNGNGDTIKRYADTVRSSTYESWNPETIGDGEVTCKLRTYGPGGVSAWKTVVGTMPNPVRTSGYRFLDGKMKVEVSSIHPTCEVWYTDRNGPYIYDGERGEAAETITIAESANWGRSDGRAWQMKIRPNNYQGWTGRDQNLGYLIKLNNPYYMRPSGSNTRRHSLTGGPHDWVDGQSEWQGANSGGGLHTAYFFYGGDWLAVLGENNIGYTLNATSAQIAIDRENTGGYPSPVHPRLMLHRATQNQGDITHSGNYDTAALSRGESGWCPVPSDWIEMLVKREHDYKGLGMFHANNNLIASQGHISTQFMGVKAYGHGSVGGYPVFTVRVYHTG